MQKVPQGSKIKGVGVYDNTATNEHNPNNPPVMVTAGLNTNDEMFLVYFHYMLYQNGDENYDMEELMSAGLADQLVDDQSPLHVFPNPFEVGMEISMETNEGAQASVFVYDYTGKLVKRVLQNEVLTSGKLSATWDGTNESGQSVNKGVYFLSVTIDGKGYTKQVVKL
jgi:hypothetical protein